MDDGRELWVIWQSLLKNYAPLFRRGGWVRFVQWVTAMVQCGEEHTITQGLTAVDLESRWRVLEHFAEYGSFDRPAVERQTMRLIEQEHPSRWAKYRCVALDDTKEHRTSADVWGEETWWHRPEWNRRKNHPSVLDLRRLFWRHRARFSKFLVRLEEFAKPPQARFLPRKPTARAA